MSVLTASADEAKADFGRYLDAAERGETIVILKGDRAIARIVPEQRPDDAAHSTAGDWAPLFGVLGPEAAEELRNAVADCRGVDAGAW